MLSSNLGSGIELIDVSFAGKKVANGRALETVVEQCQDTLKLPLTIEVWHSSTVTPFFYALIVQVISDNSAVIVSYLRNS